MKHLPVFVNCDLCGVRTDEYVICTKKLSSGEFDFFSPLCFNCDDKINNIKKIKIKN